MRKIFVANWKMHMTRGEARAYSETLARLLDGAVSPGRLVLAPPFTALGAAWDPEGRWSLAGQNVAAEREGAFTGEVSAAMLAEAECRYAIVGHSERRRIFGEGEDLLAKKLARVREAGLTPIYCVGETAQERAAGRTPDILERQAATLGEDPPGAPLVLAYEPVWAIGSGTAATPKDAGEARALLSRLFSWRKDITILYGGSVTPGNAQEFLAAAGMDGLLVGGASLKPNSFAAIAGVRSV